MRLSDFFPTEQVLRDAEFTSLGLSNSSGPDGMLSFLEDPRYASELLENPRIRAVLCTDSAAGQLPESMGAVVCQSPRRAYFTLHNRLAQSPDYCPPQAPSVIPASCRVSPLAYIAPTGVVLGERVTVEEFVSIHGPCQIGDGCVLHPGVKLGGAGYEFKYSGDEVLDVAHCGGVELGENVVLWENVTVHRAVYPWDRTVIGANSRIGAQSHIDHGAKIGRCVKVCAGCVVSGRTVVGAHALLGPGSVCSNRITVGDHARVLLGSVVTKDVPAGMAVSGNFAIGHADHIAQVKGAGLCAKNEEGHT